MQWETCQQVIDLLMRACYQRRWIATEAVSWKHPNRGNFWVRSRRLSMCMMMSARCESYSGLPGAGLAFGSLAREGLGKVCAYYRIAPEDGDTDHVETQQGTV